MKEQDAIELLKGMQNPLQDYADVVGVPAWACGCRYVYPDPEDYAIDEAIAALKDKESRKWISVAERMPTENEYRVVYAAHSGKPLLRRFEVAYITDTTEYQFGYYDGYKWIDKSNKEIPNVVAWKIHEPFNPQN